MLQLVENSNRNDEQAKPIVDFPGRGFWVKFFKCGESGECGEKNNSPHFIAKFLAKIHREIHCISYKKSPHLLFNVYSI